MGNASEAPKSMPEGGGAEKKCEKCGAVFVPRHPNHRMCNKCATEAFAKRSTARPREERPARPPAPRPADSSLRDYLAPSGYYDSEGRLRNELYTSWAQGWADLLAGKLRAHQLHLFYNHVKRAEAALRAGRPFDDVRAEILKIKPFAAARYGRGQIPQLFRQFLDINVDHVKDQASLRAFAEHFQAVVGYATAQLKG